MMSMVISRKGTFADFQRVSHAGSESGFSRTEYKLLRVKWDGLCGCENFEIGQESMERSIP